MANTEPSMATDRSLADCCADLKEIGELMSKKDELEMRALRLSKYLGGTEPDLVKIMQEACKNGEDPVRLVSEMVDFLEDHREWTARYDAIKNKTDALL